MNMKNEEISYNQSIEKIAAQIEGMVEYIKMHSCCDYYANVQITTMQM